MEQERKEDTLARVPLAHGENSKRGNLPETGGWKWQTQMLQERQYQK